MCSHRGIILTKCCMDIRKSTRRRSSCWWRTPWNFMVILEFLGGDSRFPLLDTSVMCFFLPLNFSFNVPFHVLVVECLASWLLNAWRALRSNASNSSAVHRTVIDHPPDDKPFRFFSWTNLPCRKSKLFNISWNWNFHRPWRYSWFRRCIINRHCLNGRYRCIGGAGAASCASNASAISVIQPDIDLEGWV